MKANAVALALTILLGTGASAQQPLIRGRVVGVMDGDTIKILLSDNQLLRIRLAFIDAPEKRQPFGARSKQAMSDLVFDKEVDLKQHSIDRYGRTVAQVAVEGKDVGTEMLTQGLAWVYDRYIPEASSDLQIVYDKAQEEARTEKVGVWTDPAAIPPWVFRQLAKANQQQKLASGWMSAHPNAPNRLAAPLISPLAVELPVNSNQVWVNTKSGKYWNPGSLYYGKTKRGEYMSQEKAVLDGYKPANGSGN